MWTRLPSVLGLSGLAVALAVMPADAGSSRFTTFLIACDGSNKHVDVNAAGFPASTTQFILGGEATVFGPSLLYMVVRGEGDEQKQVLTVGPGGTRVGASLPTFYSVSSNASGNVLITIDSACTPGSGSVQALVTIFFN